MRKKKQAESVEKDLARFKQENEALRAQLQRALGDAQSLNGECFATRVRALEFLLSRQGAVAVAEAEAAEENKEAPQASGGDVSSGSSSSSALPQQRHSKLPKVLSSAELAVEWHTCVRDVLRHGDAVFRRLKQLRGALTPAQLEALLEAMVSCVSPGN
jgi:hypothetical protein